MAGPNPSVNSISYGAVDQAGHVQILTFNNSYYVFGAGFTFYASAQCNGEDKPYDIINGTTGQTYFDDGDISIPYDGGTYGNMQAGSKVPCDAALSVRAHSRAAVGGDKYSGYWNFTSYAITPTAGTPACTAKTASTADINCNFYPNTNSSSATVYLEYKKASDSTWIKAGADLTGQTGYSVVNIARSLSGLEGNTTYNFRLQMTRTTVNDTTLTSATSSFTTDPAAPTITTVAAGNVNLTTADLNATLDSNGISTDVTFQWGPAANHTQYETSPATNWSTDGDHGITKGITGLIAATPYYFRAKAVYAGGTVYGSELSFTTPANPAAEALQEARMQVYEYKRKYGVVLTAQPLFFTLQTPAATNSNTFVVGATVLAADCLISKDGGAFIQTSNQPATLGNGYTLSLTAAEMQANEIDVIIKDASGGPDFRDCHLRIITNVQLGSVDIDAATGQKANTTALKATGYGSGSGIKGVGGATGKDIEGLLGSMVLRTGTAQAADASSITLDAGASTTVDYFKNTIVMVISSSVGYGQARLITGYSAGRVATVAGGWTAPTGTVVYAIIPGPDVWTVGPGAELASLPDQASASTGTYGKLLQFLFQRFAFSIKQDNAYQIMYKADSATPLATSSFTDNTTNQIRGKLS